MASRTASSSKELPTDVLALIFDHLLGDSKTLSRLSRVSKAWHSLLLPSLLHTVDLSCHNLGRLREQEVDLKMFKIIYADYADRLRPEDRLVPCQRAFVRFLTEHPELAIYVKSFTWTLIWYDFDDTSLTEVDLQIWNVFERMTSVTKLDLASLHEIADEPYIRQNPDRLFPGVLDLRLVGWMHQGLVKAIVSTLDAEKLRSLTLDHLQDEGMKTDATPMDDDTNRADARSQRNHGHYTGHDEDSLAVQERREEPSYPGPMWQALRQLRSKPLKSMSNLHVRLPPFDTDIDLRNYHTMFAELAECIISARQTLTDITISQGESIYLNGDEDLTGTCGTWRVLMDAVYSPWCFDMSHAFLQRILPALTNHQYPRLRAVNLEGFRIIASGHSRLRNPPDPNITWHMIDRCPFVDVSFVSKANIDRRQTFAGYA